MIDEEKLRKKIERTEKIHKCSLHFESAKKLIKKVQEEYKGMLFKNLVEDCAKKLELQYNYCRVAFAYLSGKKRKKPNIQKNKNTEHLQRVFSFDF